jgi:hypothetical protein
MLMEVERIEAAHDVGVPARERVPRRRLPVGIQPIEPLYHGRLLLAQRAKLPAEDLDGHKAGATAEHVLGVI